MNTELGARYSTRWLRSGCPIRTAPGDSATGTGRSAICSGPCNNATLSQNSNTAMQERDRHIRAIERHGRREWYKLSGYTKRSMVENAVYRYKAIIGPEMRARTLARQRVEHRIGCEILNKMAALGMPDTYCAG